MNVVHLGQFHVKGTLHQIEPRYLTTYRVGRYNFALAHTNAHVHGSSWGLPRLPDGGTVEYGGVSCLEKIRCSGIDIFTTSKLPDMCSAPLTLEFLIGFHTVIHLLVGGILWTAKGILRTIEFHSTFIR